MARGAVRLIGEHDFSVFRSAECQAKSPVKTLRRISVKRRGELLVLDFEASAFLHHMVRNIVGALVSVGSGAQAPEWIDHLLASRSRREAPPTFAASGLYFVGVDYDPVWQLKVGADETPIPIP
jgi:tRNA pseudouridine38-40 synthase